MSTIIFLAMIGLFLAGVALYEPKEDISKPEINMDEVVMTGKYIHGHPDIDKPVTFTFINIEDDNLVIYNKNRFTDNKWADAFPEAIGKIPKKSIDNILAEDASKVERRVTIGRLLLVGIFAFGLKKQKKDELAYLTIEWKQGKFKHETFFEFSGSGAMTNANQRRNALIKKLE